MRNVRVKNQNSRTSKSKTFKPRVAVALLSTLFFIYSSTEIFGQDEKIPKGVVPPPLSVLSKDSKKLLDASVKISSRTKLAVGLMNSRLLKASEFSKKDEYQKSLNQLGFFQAVLRNHMKYLQRRQNDRRALKHFKRFEMALRRFLPRLELIRRAAPFKYGYHVKVLSKNVRKARRAAINPFFDDTVIPNDKN